MSWKLKYLFVVIVVITSFTSCNLEKRHYTNGYHIESRWLNKTTTSPNESQEKEEITKTKITEPILSMENTKDNFISERTISVDTNLIVTSNNSTNNSVNKAKAELMNDSIFDTQKIKEYNYTASDTLKKTDIIYNEKVVFDGEESLIGALVTMGILTLFLFLGFLFVFNPTIGMFWLAATFLLPASVICYFSSLFNGIKAGVFLKRGWIPEKNKKMFIGWLLLLLLNTILIIMLTLLLIAMFA